MKRYISMLNEIFANLKLRVETMIFERIFIVEKVPVAPSQISSAICIAFPGRFLSFRASHSSATSPPAYPINLKSSLAWYNLLSSYFPSFFFLLLVHLLPDEIVSRDWSTRKRDVIYLKAPARVRSSSTFSFVYGYQPGKRFR